MSEAAESTQPKAILCDADGCLFPSEEPAFEASAQVTNEFLASLGIEISFTGEALRLATTGKNFRTTAGELAASHGASLPSEVLERWVAIERDAVTRKLSLALRPEEDVIGPLARIGETHPLAVVSSSAASRVNACLEATGLSALFASDVRFSAEDSLPIPTSKPDPAIYRFALARLGLDPTDALAVEDSVPGVQSAIAAGVATVGNLMFVPAPERAARAEALVEEGVVAIIHSWSELEKHLSSAPAAARSAPA